MKKGGNPLNKRAELNEAYHVLIQILIAVGIYLALQSYIDSVAKDTLFEKHYLANDVALLTNTIYGSPADLQYYYSNLIVELKKFEFEFKNQKVKVDEVKDEGKIIIEIPFGEDTAVTTSAQPVSEQEQILFSKTQNNIEISSG